ncbi:hypothetical protein Hanom_Chr05g00461641 [Helianthus anomalus]
MILTHVDYESSQNHPNATLVPVIFTIKMSKSMPLLNNNLRLQ